MVRIKKTMATAEDSGLLTQADGKVRAVLDAARTLFFDLGYDQTSMDRVAQVASVSKATVYSHFNSKEQLLLALVRHEMEMFLPKPLAIPASQSLGVEASLRRIAERFISLFLTDSGLALYRLVMTEAFRFPEIGRAFNEWGPKRMHNDVVSFLQDAVSQGLLNVPNIDLAAVQFLSLVRGDLPLHWALSLGQPSREQLEELVESGIHVFMAAYGPGESAG
jgi:TetR/AcrR family transcriptional repressor of mexJK operon